jgi:hypothetical protein
MKLSISIFTSLACSLVMGELLVGYDASRGDAVAEMGPLLNLEKSDDDRVPSNIPNLYIKKDKDWSGTPCAHVHRKQRYTR